MKQLILHAQTRHMLEAVTAHPKGSYLFIGPDGSGRRSSALQLAARLHCGAQPSCSNCHLLESGAHPDLITLEPSDTGRIGIDAIHELQSRLSMTRSSMQGIRLVIINDADSLTMEAQNALLKTIEEPADATMIVLTTMNTNSLIPTVLSRCGVVHFAQVPAQEIAALLVSDYQLDKTTAVLVAELADAVPGRAVSTASDQSQLDIYRRVQNMAERIETASMFDRLLLVDQIQKSSINPRLLLTALATRLRQALRTQASSQGAGQLDALEQFERHLSNNVNLKSALSYLLITL